MLRKISVLAFMALVIVVSAYAADATGKWTAEFDTPIGMLHYTYDLKVDGSTVTGTASYERGSTAIQEGKVSGDEISFVENVEIEGNELRIEYTGKISGDEIKFHRVVGDFGSEDFVATREK